MFSCEFCKVFKNTFLQSLGFLYSFSFYLQLGLSLFFHHLWIWKYKASNTSLSVLLNKKVSFVTSGMIIYYKTPLFPFLKVNMLKRLQTLYVLLLFTSYLYKNESDKTIFTNTLNWKSLYVFVYETQTTEVVKTTFIYVSNYLTEENPK